MRIRVMIVLVLVATMLVRGSPAGAYSADFEGYPDGTVASALAVPGITFSATGDWKTYSGYTNSPYLEGKALGSFDGNLTMTFASPQAAVHVGYGTLCAFTAEGYSGGSVVQSVPVGNGHGMLDMSYAGGFDSVTLVFPSCTNTAIDNIVTSAAELGGCDSFMPVPDNAVMGAFVADAPASWAPGNLTSPLITLEAGKTALVLGQDASGQYYKVQWQCTYLWVPASSMGPDYDDVWLGRPLPTDVVD
jgi:hypothetical protein